MMEKQIYHALKCIIIGNLRQAYLHMDDVDFADLLTAIKGVIQSYEKVELADVRTHADNRHEK